MCKFKTLSLSQIVYFILTAFILNSLGPIPTVKAQELILPQAGTSISLSPKFNPLMLKGIKVHPDNPLKFDFILDPADTKGADSNSAVRPIGGQELMPVPDIKQESTKLIKYFLASLTIPEADLWVNLSPYEKNRIVPDAFGKTEMGRDLLAEDYILKQITASLMYPEGETGKKFWKRIYEVAAKRFGTTDVPVNTFNKVWIVPDKAIVYENAKAGTAYVVKSLLKVMLEEDYLSMRKHADLGGLSSGIPKTYSKAIFGHPNIGDLSSQVIREIIIPELDHEVNQGQNFAQLRQVYNSLILATWYKMKIRDSILAAVYENKNKIKGLNYSALPARGHGASRVPMQVAKQESFEGVSDPEESTQTPNQQSNPKVNSQDDVEQIYQQYIKAFKKGAYNYIKEEDDPITKEIIPKKYFAGGVDERLIAATLTFSSNQAMLNQVNDHDLIATITLSALGARNAAMNPLADLLQEKYTADPVKAESVAQEIRQDGTHYKVSPDGWTMVVSATGHELVRISKLGTKQYFDQEGHWLLTVDPFGHVMEELEYDTNQEIIRVRGLLPSHERFVFENTQPEQRMKRELSVIRFESSKSDWINALPYTVATFFSRPFKIRNISERNLEQDNFKLRRGLSSVIFNLLSSYVQFYNLRKGDGQESIRFAGDYANAPILRTIKKIAQTSTDVVLLELLSTYLWKPDPVERILNKDTGIYLHVRNNEIERAVTRDKQQFTKTGMVFKIVKNEQGNFDLISEGHHVWTVDLMGNIISSSDAAMFHHRVDEHGILHDKLSGGATVKTSLDPDDYEMIKLYPKKYFTSQLEGKTQLYGRYKKWNSDTTSLSEIDKCLKLLGLVRQIHEDNLRQNKVRKLVIFDWGVGNAQAIIELSAILKSENIPHHIYGLSMEYSPNWEHASEDITFILDSAVNLPRYGLNPNSIDVIFSHLGLNHFLEKTDWRRDNYLITGKEQEDHMAYLRLIQRPGGVLRIWGFDVEGGFPMVHGIPFNKVRYADQFDWQYYLESIKPRDAAMNLGTDDVFTPADVFKSISASTDNIKKIKDAKERNKWEEVDKKARLVLRDGVFVYFDGKKNKIRISYQSILAFTFLLWLSEAWEQKDTLEKARTLFFSKFLEVEKKAKDWAKIKYRSKFDHELSDEDFIEGFYREKSQNGVNAEELFKIELEEGLLNLRRFGYKDQFVELPKQGQQVLKPEGSAINVGIHHHGFEVGRIALAKHGGKNDSGINAVLIPWDSAFEIMNVFPYGMRAIARAGIVFKDGVAYFMRFNEPLLLDYVVSYDKQTLLRLADEGIPSAGHPFIDDYLEEKDVTTELAQEAGIHVPKTKLFLIKDGDNGFVEKRRDQRNRGQGQQIVHLQGYRHDFLFVELRNQLIDFLTKNNLKKGVIKPNRGIGGENVFFYDLNNIQAAVEHVVGLIMGDKNVLLQERIDSAPILKDGQVQDWNLRVFVSKNKLGQTVVSDMVGRIGPYGNVINGSRGASWIRLDTLKEDLQLDELTFAKLKQEIEKVSIRMFDKIQETMGQDGMLKKGQTAVDFMGLDIMVKREDDGSLVPYLIEANGVNSGGGFKLDEALEKAGEIQRQGQWARDWFETMKNRVAANRREHAQAAMISNPQYNLSYFQWHRFVDDWRVYNGETGLLMPTDTSDDSEEQQAFYQPFRRIDIRKMVSIGEKIKRSEKNRAVFLEYGAGTALGSYLIAREGQVAIAVEHDEQYVQKMALMNDLVELEPGSKIFMSKSLHLPLVYIAGDVHHMIDILDRLKTAIQNTSNHDLEFWKSIDLKEIDVAWDGYQAEDENWLPAQAEVHPRAIFHIWNAETGTIDSYVDTPQYQSLLYWQGPGEHVNESSYFHLLIRDDLINSPAVLALPVYLENSTSQRISEYSYLDAFVERAKFEGFSQEVTRRFLEKMPAIELGSPFKGRSKEEMAVELMRQEISLFYHFPNIKYLVLIAYLKNGERKINFASVSDGQVQFKDWRGKSITAYSFDDLAKIVAAIPVLNSQGVELGTMSALRLLREIKEFADENEAMKSQTDQTNAKLVSIVSNPEKSLKDRPDDLPAIDDELAGTTDSRGFIRIEIEKGQVLTWSLFGDDEDYVGDQREGWVVLIEKGRHDRNKGLYTLNVQLKKDGTVLNKIFVINNLLTKWTLKERGQDKQILCLNIVDEIEVVKKVIEKIILEPDQLSANLNELPNFEGFNIPLDQHANANLRVGVDKTFGWSVAGVDNENGKGYTARIVESKVEGKIWTFNVEILKDGISVALRNYQISDLLAYYTADKIEGLAISHRLAWMGLREHFLTPDALEKSRTDFKSLVGLKFGKTNDQSEIPFTPFKGDQRKGIFLENRIGPGWEATIIADKMNEHGFYEFTVELSKPGEESKTRVLEIGRFERKIDVDGQEVSVFDIVPKDKIADTQIKAILVDIEGYNVQKVQEKLEALRGLNWRTTSFGSVIAFIFNPAAIYNVKFLGIPGNDGAGWKTEIVKAWVDKEDGAPEGINKVTIRFFKGKESYLRDFKIDTNIKDTKGVKHFRITALGPAMKQILEDDENQMGSARALESADEPAKGTVKNAGLPNLLERKLVQTIAPIRPMSQPHILEKFVRRPLDEAAAPAIIRGFMEKFKEGDSYKIGLKSIFNPNMRWAIKFSRSHVEIDEGAKETSYVELHNLQDIQYSKNRGMLKIRFQDDYLGKKEIFDISINEAWIKEFIKIDPLTGQPIDGAMLNNGGIDMRIGKDFILQDAGQSIIFHMDQAQLQVFQNASGFIPTSMRFHPMKNLREFLTQP